MMLTRRKGLHTLQACVVWMVAALGVSCGGPRGDAQGVTTTTVQGTVYLATGQPGSGTLVVKWPAFTTANGQAVAADSLTAKIGADGFVTVSVAPNEGATPAGLFYTAVYYMSDGSTSTEYWVVPAAAQATLAQVRTQVMPAAQAVQAVTKTYVDQQVSELTQSLLTASGGNLSGPLFLNSDPTQDLQAADKHYVDTQVADSVPIAGGTMTGSLLLNADPVQDLQAADKRYVDTAAASAWPGAVLRADQFSGTDFGAKLQACVNAVNASYGGTCDARNFSGSVGMSTNVTIPSANTNVLLPCATIATANQIVIPGGARNVALHGCAQRGGSASSGITGGTAFAYSGARALAQVGDPGYGIDTPGFHMDNVVIDTTAATSATAQGLAAYRTQELDLESVYFLGNANQTAMTLDGTGNYAGGTFLDDQFVGFQTAINGIGHQTANPAATDWVNASTFLRVHIDCPMSNGAPIPGTYGINLQQGDGNTFTGGDVENCSTALHLGANAQNNTIIGLRNENSTVQVAADAGSAYNNWITGGTMFTGKLVDSGTRNSFLDTFHRSFNALNGDWYGSQQDATLTNHYRLGTGAGNERGLLDRYQTDAGYRWTTGLSDATGGEQFYQILDELNNVYRISVGQYNSGQSSTNNQTVINAAGTGAVVLNGSNNSGTGGVVIGSGGPNASTVATISNAGNAQFNGTLQVAGGAQSNGTMTVRNNADAEVDYYLWPGLTASQKGSFTYKDYNGNSQWYMVKDQSNNWALNSALGGLDSFKAYQSTNSGDTYVNAANASGVVRVNYESGSGNGFKIYGGNSSALYASFTGASSIALPGLAAASGHNCLQIDSSGYISNTGAACGSGGGSGTVGSGSSGQIAYYTGNGTAIGGTSTVPMTSGGTGATTAAAALQNLGGLAQAGGSMTGPLNGTSATFTGTLAAGAVASSAPPALDLRNPSFAGGVVCNGYNADILPALQAAINTANANYDGQAVIRIVGTGATACYLSNPNLLTWPSGRLYEIEITGVLWLGTTWTLPSNAQVNLIGKGNGASAVQFQNSFYPASILLTNHLGAQSGALGIAVSTTPGTGSTVTFTPPGGIGALVAGDAIDVAGTLTCNIRNISRSGNTVTALLSSSCHIPAGVRDLTVAGVTDSSFNGSFNLLSSDYNTNTMTWSQSGTNGSSSGGTVNGLNVDTVETVQVSSCTATACTATFYRPHTSSDVWDVAAVQLQSASQNLVDIGISNPFGSPLFIAMQGYLNRIDRCGLGGLLPVSIDAANFITFENASAFIQPSTSNPTTMPWSIRFWNHALSGLYGYATGLKIIDSWISGEIELDWGATGIYMDDVTNEHPAAAMIVFDGTYSAPIAGDPNITIVNSQIQDTGYASPFVDVYFPYPNTGRGRSQLVDLRDNRYLPGAFVNDYFDGKIKTDSDGYYRTSYSQGIVGTLNNGKKIIGELEGEGAELGPQMIPYPTANISQNPSSWSATCGTYTAGGIAPHGSESSMVGVLVSSGNCYLSMGSVNETPHLGDYVLFGGWAMTPDWNNPTSSGGGYQINFNNSNHFYFNYLPTTVGQAGIINSGPFDSDGPNAWWHPVVSLVQVTQADGASGSISLQGTSTRSGYTEEFWRPFMIYIPAAQLTGTSDGLTGTITSVIVTSGTLQVGMDISGTGIPAHSYITAISGSTVTINQNTTASGSGAMSAQLPYRLVNMWRTEMLHGAVPGNWGLTGVAATTEPIASVPNATSISGTSGTANCSEGLQGTQKYTSCYLSGYAQTGAAQTYAFPAAYNTAPVLLESGGSCGSYNPTVTATTLTLPASASMTAETCNVVVLGQ